MSKLKISLINTEILIPYANNARVHSDEQVSQIAASIREFGFNNPVLIDSDNGIIAGHGRVLAAKKLSMESIPCVQLEHLTEAQKKAYIIADNKLAENAEWDNELLKIEISSLEEDYGIEAALLGFGDVDLEALENSGDGYDPDSGEQNGTDEADTQLMLGPYRIPISRDRFLMWEEAIRDSVGFDKESICQEMTQRMKL